MSAPSAAQAVDDGGDPVGLLDAQLLRAGDDRLALGEAAEQGDQRQLVDRERHLVRLDDRADQRPGGDVELADRLLRRDLARPRRLEIADDDAAHALDDPDEARCGSSSRSCR